MRIFHLSDLHIGLKLMNYDLSEDQAYILDQIAQLAKTHQPDAVVIAGDIYDKAIPSGEAAALFDDFISKLDQVLAGAQIMMISGNHDSAKRLNVFRSVLKKQHVSMVGMPPMQKGDRIEKVRLEDDYGSVYFYLLPFVRPSMVRALVEEEEDDAALSYDETIRRLLAAEQIDQTQRNVLVSHQFYLPIGADAQTIERADSEIRTVGNIDEVKADVLDPFDYAALGHIHKPMTVGDQRFHYCGTPLACSLSEEGQEKGVLMVDMGEKGELEITKLPLRPLRQIRRIAGSLQEVCEQTSDDYVAVTLTDETDLDILDMQARLRAAFPHLLQVERKHIRGASYQQAYEETETMDMYELCKNFLGDLTSEEEDVLAAVINEVKEGNL